MSWIISLGYICVHKYVKDEFYMEIYDSVYWYADISVGDKVGMGNDGSIYWCKNACICTLDCIWNQTWTYLKDWCGLFNWVL